MELQMGQSRPFEVQLDDITSLAKANRFSGNGNDNSSVCARERGSDRERKRWRIVVAIVNLW